MGKLDNYVCDGQMSIFDFIKPTNESKFPGIIGQLDKELTERLGINDSKYEVWSHVPNLGKRYSLYGDIDNAFDITDIIEKYKPLNLEISCIGHKSVFDNNKFTIHISTLWTTNGHKEML